MCVCVCARAFYRSRGVLGVRIVVLTVSSFEFIDLLSQVNGRRGPDSSVGVTYFESDKRTKGVGNGKFRATVDGRSRKYYDCHELGYDLARTVAEHLAAENSRRRQEAAKVARDARVVERRNQPRPLTGNCDDIWAAITRIESLVQLQKLVVPVDGACVVVCCRRARHSCTDILFVFVFSVCERPS